MSNPVRLSVSTAFLVDRMPTGGFFGVTPAIEQGPDGDLYVVSISGGVVYRISRAAAPPGAKE